MLVGRTKSLCPVCLRLLEAEKVTGQGGIYLEKRCPEHGKFSVLIWEGELSGYLRWGRENNRQSRLFCPVPPKKAAPLTAGSAESICARAAACCWS